MTDTTIAKAVMPLALSMASAIIGLATVVAIMSPGTYPQANRDWRPAVQADIHPTSPVVAATRLRRREIGCLASAIWFEAGNQPHEGRVAIAEVVLARMRSGIYPRRACAVIAQRKQFSFVRKGVIPPVPFEKAAEITRIALAVMDGRQHSRFKGAMWFHATYVNPGWSLPRLGSIGEHVFYGQNG